MSKPTSVIAEFYLGTIVQMSPHHFPSFAPPPPPALEVSAEQGLHYNTALHCSLLWLQCYTPYNVFIIFIFFHFAFNQFTPHMRSLEFERLSLKAAVHQA